MAYLEARMHGLNPPQSAAVSHCDGPLLVLAGAGSGKTGDRRENRAPDQEPRFPAKRIAAITFTNRPRAKCASASAVASR